MVAMASRVELLWEASLGTCSTRFSSRVSSAVRSASEMRPLAKSASTAIIGFGKTVERPCAIDGEIVARPVVTATLSADHRVSDGHKGALLLAEIDARLQKPEDL